MCLPTTSLWRRTQYSLRFSQSGLSSGLHFSIYLHNPPHTRVEQSGSWHAFTHWDQHFHIRHATCRGVCRNGQVTSDRPTYLGTPVLPVISSGREAYSFAERWWPTLLWHLHRHTTGNGDVLCSTLYIASHTQESERHRSSSLPGLCGLVSMLMSPIDTSLRMYSVNVPR